MGKRIGRDMFVSGRRISKILLYFNINRTMVRPSSVQKLLASSVPLSWPRCCGHCCSDAAHHNHHYHHHHHNQHYCDYVAAEISWGDGQWVDGSVVLLWRCKPWNLWRSSQPKPTSHLAPIFGLELTTWRGKMRW